MCEITSSAHVGTFNLLPARLVRAQQSLHVPKRCQLWPSSSEQVLEWRRSRYCITRCPCMLLCLASRTWATVDWPKEAQHWYRGVVSICVVHNGKPVVSLRVFYSRHGEHKSSKCRLIKQRSTTVHAYSHVSLSNPEGNIFTSVSTRTMVA